MEWENCFVRLQMVSLVSMIFLSGCGGQPPETGDIVIGRAHHFRAELYKKELQWEKEHSERTFIQDALDAGIPRRAMQDGRVLSVGCENMGPFGGASGQYILLLPKGVKISDRLVVEFEAVTSPWNRATQEFSYKLSRFIRVSDIDYYDVPDGCIWYHNGRLVEGRDRAHEGQKNYKAPMRLPPLLEDFRIE